MHPSIAVVVPATDTPPTLERCLESLRASADPADEIVVVTEPAGEGPAGARNRGAAQTGADVIAFVDSDVAVHPDAIGRLRAAFAKRSRLAAVFGAYDDRPAAPGVVSQFRNLLHHHVHASSPGPAETFWAGLGAVRRDAFEAAGGFDSARFPVPAIEDIELGARLRAGGAEIVLDPAIRGTHLKRWSLAEMVATDFARRAVPWLCLQLEHRSPVRSLNLSLRHRTSAVASAGLAASVLARRPRTTAVFALALAALNARFYALLHRSGGPGLAAAGFALHALHHLVSVAAVPVALAGHLREGR